MDSEQKLSRVLQSTTYQSGTVMERVIYEYGNGLLGQYNQNGSNRLYYHFNNVGSTMAVTDVNGDVRYRYAYSPYGELIKGNYGQVLFLYTPKSDYILL